jgi:hypothetical protein
MSVRAPLQTDPRFYPESILENPGVRREPRRKRARPKVGGFLAGLLAAIALIVVVIGPVKRFLPHGAGGPRPPATTMVWGVRLSSGPAASLTAILSAPTGRPTAVVAVPGDTSVDLPGGGPTIVSDAVPTPGLAVASAQAILGVRVPHYLVIDEIDLQALVDRMGGIRVDTEATFLSGGQTLGPGPTRLLGADLSAYLATSTDTTDLTARWEDVLTGLTVGSADPIKWTFPLGQSDDVALSAKLLASMHGELVSELPTAPDDGATQPDSKAIGLMIQRSFAPSSQPLIRVVVLNGNGRPGMGAIVASLIAPFGYRVVAAQNADNFKAPVTQVVAADSSLLPQAQEMVTLLGVGKVYVGGQPTGIADITIVVGKDFKAS